MSSASMTERLLALFAKGREFLSRSGMTLSVGYDIKTIPSFLLPVTNYTNPPDIQAHA